MRKQVFVPVAFAVALLLLGASLFVGGRMSSAQDASPTAMAGATTEDHPAHIHSGTCTALGDVVYPLTNVSAADMMASPMATMESSPMAGMDTGTPEADMGTLVATSTTTVQTTIKDLTGEQYAINVHESADNIQNYIACGEITGTATNNMLKVELKELNGSGYHGEAWLTDNGDNSVTVMIKLFKGGSMATPTS